MKYIEIMQLWVVEYSVIQKALHLCPVWEMIKNNRILIHKNESHFSGFVPILISTEEEAREFYNNSVMGENCK